MFVEVFSHITKYLKVCESCFLCTNSDWGSDQLPLSLSVSLTDAINPLCFSSTTSLTLVKIVTVILTLHNKQSITWCEHVDSLSSDISSVYRTASLQSPHPIYNYYWDALICSRSPPLIHFCSVFTATWSNQITSCWYLTPHANRKTGSDIKQEETCSTRAILTQ